MNSLSAQSLVPLICEAGDAVRAIYVRGAVEYSLKEDQSFLTEADHASQWIITHGLAAMAPDIPVLSEEAKVVDYSARKNWKEYFLIDPVDGTREFVKRIPEFTVNIALVRHGKPVIGLVHLPMEGVTYIGEEGAGAYRIKQTTERLPLHRDANRRFTVFLSRTDFSPSLEQLLTKLSNPDVKRMGSSLKFCLIAEGAGDLYPRLKPSMEWDTAAGTVVVEQSGGIVCDLSGESILYNREDLVNPPFYAGSKYLEDKIPDWKRLLLDKSA